jgi:hypothetical protein
MSHEWRNTSIKIILALFFISLLLFAFSFVNHTSYTGESLAKAYNLPIGQSMFEGDSILGENQSIKVPLLSNVPFIAHQITSLDLQGLLITLTTGAVPFDFATVSSEGIDSYGRAHGFEGPGYLTYEGNQLAVKAPNTYVWGYSSPYKVLTKTSDGVDVVENGTVIESIPTSEIKNTKFGNDYYNTSTIQNWYNYDSDSSNFTLERGIVGFSDGRANISADDVSVIFGKNVSDYVAAYPDGTPIVLYMGNVTEEDGEVYSTSLGSHPQYGDSIREFNARSFVDAWNNTVIPPNSSGNGKAYIDFGSASDSNAPGGSASHGVCPPARVLRASVLAEGFSLPVGMCNDEDAVLFGYNPSEDIKVTNTHDYPVKIVMWTEGSGTGMMIYGKIERFIPK